VRSWSLAVCAACCCVLRQRRAFHFLGGIP
jgi:hypothetical protein